MLSKLAYCAARSAGLLCGLAAIHLTAPAYASTVVTNQYVWADAASSGQIRILVEAFDNFNGDFSRYEWRYTVENLSYDPVPGTTNGFSGFHFVFPLGGFPDVADQYGPSEWALNLNHGDLDPLPVPAVPPMGIGWDAEPPAFGVPTGSSGVFGFTTRTDVRWYDYGLQVAHSWNSQNGRVLNVFSGELIVPFVPEPASLGMLCSGGAAILVFTLRRSRHR